MNQIALKFHWQIIKIKLMKDKTLVCCTDACQLASRWAESGSFPSRTVNSTCSEAFVWSPKKFYMTQILLYSHYTLNRLSIFGNIWVRTSQTCRNTTETNIFFFRFFLRLTWCACSSTLTRHHRRHPHHRRHRHPRCPFSFSSARRRKKSKFVSTWIWNNSNLMQ